MCLFAMYFGHGVLTDKRQRIFGRQIDHTLDPGWSADHRREFHRRSYTPNGLTGAIASLKRGAQTPKKSLLAIHGDEMHSNDLPGCVVGDVADITQPTQGPPWLRTSLLAVSGAPFRHGQGTRPRPRPAPVGTPGAPGGPHGLMGARGGGLTTTFILRPRPF
jgi:hypothetical protein